MSTRRQQQNIWRSKRNARHPSRDLGEPTVNMNSEPEVVMALFDQLMARPLHLLVSLHAPDAPGVYVIYDQAGTCMKVGRAGEGKGCLRRRLRQHCQNRWYHQWRLQKHGCGVENDHVRWLVVEDKRRRRLLEELATGLLCPGYLGRPEKAEAAA
jgi:hypothetical protein